MKAKLFLPNNHLAVAMFGRTGLMLFALFISLTTIFLTPSLVQARDFNAEIRALQNQINDYRRRSSELANQSNTLQGKIAELNNQQAEVQAQINISSAQKEQTKKRISEAEVKMKSQSEILSRNLQEQYYNSQVSPLDVLMNSKSISEYVDRQARQQAVKNQISKSVTEIKNLKKQLEKDKTEVERIIAQQAKQKQVLENSKAEQQQILDQTQGLESKYQELTSGAESKKSQIQREQQEAIRRYNQQHNIHIAYNAQCGGGYPFCQKAPDTSASAGGFVAWGNTRECVNYVQWRIYQLTGRNEVHGNAGSWAGVANSNARPNTVGIVAYGSGLPYGHVVWVEQVGEGAREGQVYISEFNWKPFSYTERWANISSFTGGFYNPLY